MGVKSSGREYEIKSGDDVGIKDWGDMKVKFRWKKICSFDILNSGSLQKIIISRYAGHWTLCQGGWSNICGSCVGQETSSRQS